VYPVEQILGALLEMRDNQRLEKKVSLLVRSRGWSHIVEALSRCRASEAIVPGWDTQLREGVLREGLIALLHLEDFAGLDSDFLESFAELQAEDIEDLRKQARPHAIELLREQVRTGNTFFLDVEVMKEEDLVVFVPDILNARMKEIQNLSRKPDLYEVYSTYYGFQVLTTGVHIQHGGIPVEIRENLHGILSDLGGVEVLQGKQLKFSPLAFRNCTSHLTVLLWNMLRLANGGRKAKSKALDTLGEFGDSRAIDLLHSYVDAQSSSRGRTKERGLLDECLLCLGRIGNPRSFELVREISTASGKIALGGIRHPEVQRVFEKYPIRYMRRFEMIRLMTAFGKTRSRAWLSMYESKKLSEKAPSVLQAIEYAERNVVPDFDI